MMVAVVNIILHGGMGAQKKIRSNGKFRVITTLAVNARSRIRKRVLFNVQNTGKRGERAILAYY